MNIPVLVLLGFAAWTTLTRFGSVGIYRWRHTLTGRVSIGEWRADLPQGSDWYKRAIRTHMNCVENLSIYGAILVALTVIGFAEPVLGPALRGHAGCADWTDAGARRAAADQRLGWTCALRFFCPGDWHDRNGYRDRCDDGPLMRSSSGSSQRFVLVGQPGCSDPIRTKCAGSEPCCSEPEASPWRLRSRTVSRRRSRRLRLSNGRAFRSRSARPASSVSPTASKTVPMTLRCSTGRLGQRDRRHPWQHDTWTADWLRYCAGLATGIKGEDLFPRGRHLNLTRRQPFGEFGQDQPVQSSVPILHREGCGTARGRQYRRDQA
jgi:hypothetical protein